MLPQNADPRPKRRRFRDNPYTIFSVGKDTEKTRYFVSFYTTNDKEVCVEISQDIFETLDRFELDDLHFMNEIHNHYEWSEMTEETINCRIAVRQAPIDDTILNKMLENTLKEAIALLPCIQQRRLFLFYYGQLTCKQIAQMEGCSVSAVEKTLYVARNNLKKIMNQTVGSTF